MNSDDDDVTLYMQSRPVMGDFSCKQLAFLSIMQQDTTVAVSKPPTGMGIKSIYTYLFIHVILSSHKRRFKCLCDAFNKVDVGID